jgi:flagellin
VALDSQESSRIYLNEVVNTGPTDTTSLDLDSFSVASFEKVVSELAKVNYALAKVSSFRGSIGATQNRFRRELNTLNVYIENLTVAYANIKNKMLLKKSRN